jgi:hypothetical protein
LILVPCRLSSAGLTEELLPLRAHWGSDAEVARNTVAGDFSGACLMLAVRTKQDPAANAGGVLLVAICGPRPAVGPRVVETAKPGVARSDKCR